MDEPIGRVIREEGLSAYASRVSLRGPGKERSSWLVEWSLSQPTEGRAGTHVLRSFQLQSRLNARGLGVADAGDICVADGRKSIDRSAVP
jgi:hypothetical protein